MNADLDNIRISMMDAFNASQTSYEDAQQKFNQENRKKTNYMRFSKDGTYTVRILPLAPVFEDGNPRLDRKGYEYPLRELILKIDTPEGKTPCTYLAVPNVRQAYPQLENDPIDLYVKLVGELYPGDDALVKKLAGNSFSGGLRYDNRRAMYVYDLNNKSEGIQIVQLSYNQYKELETRKLAMWAKLRQRNPQAQCPVCSPADAYPVEITRSNNNGKTEYSFNIDVINGPVPLDEADLQALFDTSRLPDVLYTYSNRCLEGVVRYLKQCDEQYGINVMDDKRMTDCIEQIKLTLPSDDTSHFRVAGADGTEAAPAQQVTLEAMWDLYDEADQKGTADERNDDYMTLRTMIGEYIDRKKLDVKVLRSKSNYDLLNEIEALEGGKPKEQAETPVEEEEVAGELEAEEEVQAAPAVERRTPHTRRRG